MENQNSDLTEILEKPNQISYLKLSRLKSLNIDIFPSTLITKNQFSILPNTPIEKEILELSDSLNLCSEFYSLITDTSKIHDQPEEPNYEGQIEKPAQRLEELMNKQNNNYLKYRRIFLESGGIKCLVTCLKNLALFIQRKDACYTAKKVTFQRVKSVLTLFDSLYLGDIKMPLEISFDDNLIELLFGLFEYEEIFDSVLHATEDLLISRESVFPLQKIKNFYKYFLILNYFSKDC